MNLPNSILKTMVGLAMSMLIVGFSGCAPSILVSSDYEKTTNFAQYRTWRWYQDQPVAKSDSTRRYSTFLDKRIKNAVEAEMNRRGFQLASGSQQPDMLLAYDVTIENMQRVRPDYVSIPTIGYGYWYGYRYAYTYNRLYNNTTVQEYQAGTIILDIVDAKSNELVWRGTGQTTGGEKSLTQEKVQAVVTQILAKYPPSRSNEGATANR
ncbi:DUF4136 domain-containing protein [Nibribacter ruber]|uniref:DUF4136 domain-containing protein n=1 Tax=Nibribacter ruber TaxID=2698458 RepID=A0A6P1NVF9_9BACT|nr:DUF4136 domain-containing protein [Nibribacter ruber]QHL87826.1 DUF4136 domain-containing protein [Nibribacter ruber]